jgi:hypothetical protein
MSRHADGIVFPLVQQESRTRDFYFGREQAACALAFFGLRFPPARDFSPLDFGAARPQFFACEQESPVSLAVSARVVSGCGLRFLCR